MLDRPHDVLESLIGLVETEPRAPKAHALQNAPDLINEANVVERLCKLDMPKMTRAIVFPAVAGLAGIHTIVRAHVQIVDPAVVWFPARPVGVSMVDFHDRHVDDSLRTEDTERHPNDLMNVCCRHRLI